MKRANGGDTLCEKGSRKLLHFICRISHIVYVDELALTIYFVIKCNRSVSYFMLYDDDNDSVNAHYLYKKTNELLLLE